MILVSVSRWLGRESVPFGRSAISVCVCMAIQNVQINLKIRSLTVRSANEPPKRIDNSNLRFTKVVELASIPKPGDVLDMTAGAGQVPFHCTVTRSEWDDRENMFVVSCSYTKTPMPEADYRAVSEGSDWTMKFLL
jgi:hypothetical protein